MTSVANAASNTLAARPAISNSNTNTNTNIELLAQAEVTAGRAGGAAMTAARAGVSTLLAPVANPYVPAGSMEIKGISKYRENAGLWADQPYQFGDKNNPLKGTMAELGCTISAFSNATSVNNQKNSSFAAPTPGDANQRNARFDNAMAQTKWKSLTVPSLLNANGQPSFNQLSQPVDLSSLQGKKLIEAIRTEVAAGRPVVLGMTGNKEGFVRHTVLVTGLVPGKTGAESLIVRDQWRGAGGNRDSSEVVKPAFLTTLAETLKAYPEPNSGGYTKIDMAISAAPGKQ
jgi:hypothetical protein